MIAYFVIVPASSLVYGWCLQQNIGGIALAAVMSFFIGLGLLMAFAGLNTYCAGERMRGADSMLLKADCRMQRLCRAQDRK